MERKVETKVGKEAAGRSLLDWLEDRFTYFGRTGWATMIEEGRLAVNRRTVNVDTSLAAGDRISFSPPESEEPAVDPGYLVLYEDEDFLIVDKPPLLPCHPGGRFFKHSLWYLLKMNHERIQIATRLDRETSGLVLVALNPSAARHIQLLRETESFAKRYLVMVHGRFPERLVAKGFLLPDRDSTVRKKRKFIMGPALGAEVGEGAESSETRFEFLGGGRLPGLPSGDFSILRAEPISGRTHQIRATLFSLGFPVVGDKLYGLDEGCFVRFAEGSLRLEDRARLILPFQALHSATLSFPDKRGEIISASALPPWGSPFADVVSGKWNSLIPI